ncbi:unnamed protein product [Malus baccata var. baccata]
MAPKVAQTQSPCKTGEGITTMYRLFNDLHRHRAGLSSRAAIIVPVDSTCEYKVIFPCTNIHKPRLPYSFCFLDHFIILGVCFGINYHNLVGFRINVKDFGRTCGRRLCYEGKDYKGVF